MLSIAQPVRVLIDPVDAIAPAVEARRWALPLLVFALCAGGSGAAFAVRWDGTSQVVTELSEQGELRKVSEREITEKVQTAERVKLVGSVARGLLVSPLLVLALAAVLKFTGWLFGTKVPFGRGMAAAAIAMLPLALYHLLLALACLRSDGVTDAGLGTLLPSSLAALTSGPPRLARLFGAIDFFSFWSVGLLGLGFSAASGMRRARALAVSGMLFLAYLAVFTLGLGGKGGPA